MPTTIRQTCLMLGFLFFTGASSLFSRAAVAGDTSSTVAADPNRVDRGWFFYDDPVKQKQVEQDLVTAVAPPANLPPDNKPKPDHCKKASTWAADCGFVDPGKNFAWQSAERDALLQQMVLNPVDQSAVEAFQHYNKWVMDKALLVAKTWHWNTIQHPDLDPRVSTPISQSGLLMADTLRGTRAPDIYKWIAANGGMLFYFTRADCPYCHDMAGSFSQFAEQTGIPTYDASIYGNCVKPFDGSHCLPPDQSYGPAGVLNVSVVPAVILYLPSNTWIRLATGFTTSQHIEDRLVNFFTAWRTAVVRGLSSQNGTAPVDFDPTHAPDLGVGIGAGAGTANIPTANDIKSLLFQ